MPELNISVAKNSISAILVSALFVLSVLPGFKLLGNLLAQVLLTIVLNIAIHLIIDLVFKIKPVITSYALILMTVFCMLIAIFKQIQLHISTNDFSFKWLHLFYYDKPALIFVVMFVAILYYIIRLFSKKNDASYIDLYKKFIQITIRCLLVYYALILFYCFYLVREITFVRAEPNLIPFKVISFSVSRIDYELLFLLLGNIAIFFPLGVIVSSITKNKSINIMLPILISVCIEISQYYLGNGHPDIDDVILNVIGYYVGIGVRVILDHIVYIASDKRFRSFMLL